MCGIFCACTYATQKDELTPIFQDIRPMLEKRGPNYQNCQLVNSNNHTLMCAASVLWMQGKNLTEQPIIDNTSVFMYNGDIFEGLAVSDQGDTVALHNILKKSVDIKALSSLKGPYSFIYIDREQSKLYFCRDPFGRRSLLITYYNQMLVLTSVAKKSLFGCTELPAIGIFIYDLKTKDFYLQPWEFKHSNFFMKINELETALNKSINLLEDVKIESNDVGALTCNNLAFLQQLSQYEGNEIFTKILDNPEWYRNILHLKGLLEKAVEVRVKTLCHFCRNCFGKTNNCNHCSVGVLFSGGIDCSVLTLLIDQYVDEHHPIDLINVAFDPRASDRQTGLQTLQELKQLRPNRSWNFLEVNVDQKELNEKRTNSIADLIYPLNTILDDSLGCALWFASQGRTDKYTSSCKVLVTGMGADELFGGYTKHRIAFKQLGWEGLHKSLEEDWQNISYRNLARDDRVVSDHGRQLRIPYLDENVVKFIRSLTCSQRTFPTTDLPQGVGEKLLLRSLAYHLGLRNVATFKKKALQFGSKIANSKENAHAISPRL